jgi:hypothetical protein
VQQQRKIFTDLGGHANGDTAVVKNLEESEVEAASSMASTIHVILNTLGEQTTTFQASRECLYNAFKPTSAEQASLCFVQLHYCKDSSSSSLEDRTKLKILDTEKDKLIQLFFSHKIIVHFEYVNPLTDVFLKSCEAHRAGFRFFSGYFCGMVAKLTLLCGQFAIRVFVLDSGKGNTDSDSVSTSMQEEEQKEGGSSVWSVSSILVMISNNISLLTRIVSWASEQLTSFGVTCQCTGRMKIDVMKMLTAVSSTLFVYDIFLERYTIPSLTGPSYTHASSVITDALSCSIINLENVSQLIGYSLKHSLLTTVFSLLQVTSDYKLAIMCFIGRFLFDKSKEGKMDLDIDVGVGSWANDPSVRRIIKSEISIELANVIETLIKKV